MNSEYRFMREFSGYHAGIILGAGEVKAFGKVKFDINNLSSNEREFISRHMPDWKGEKYGYSLFRWIDHQFVFIKKYYTDDSTGAPVDLKDYDTDGSRRLNFPDKYANISVISKYLSRGIVKAYYEGDLNLDGKQDLIFYYQDTLETREAEDYIFQIVKDGHMIVFESKGHNEYKESFKYDISSQLRVGKIEVRDITKDKIPEIILWTWGHGASAWGVTARVFTRQKNSPH